MSGSKVLTQLNIQVKDFVPEIIKNANSAAIVKSEGYETWESVLAAWQLYDWSLVHRCMLPLLLWYWSMPASAETIHLIYGQSIQADDPTQHYPLELLRAAFNEVGVEVELHRATNSMVQQRSLNAIAMAQDVDVFWSMTSIEREQQLLPVRIPIDKGLYGWRLLLLAKDQFLPFWRVKDLRALQQLTLLQGHDWPDTIILEKNGIKVLTSSGYNSLFTMLAKNRGDAFPRSALEIWREQGRHSSQFKVETDVVLYYPTALYFFFNKDQQKIASQLEAGLNALIKSGEFELIFQRYFADALQKSCLGQRHKLELNNPLLPLETPLSRSELWYKPDMTAICQPKSSLQ